MKFLCDEMLAEVGRWLRIAGYDTEIVEKSIVDGEILKRAIAEHRCLLTRDREFLSMHAPEHSLVYLNGNSTEVCISLLNKELKINWLYAPFSRCLACNELLVKPSLEDTLTQVPLDIRETSDDFSYCTGCKKVYWNGSHTQKMLEQLHDWQKK